MQENLDQQITEHVPEFFFIWDLASQKIIYLTHGYREYANVRLKKMPDDQRMLDIVHPEDRQKFKSILQSLSAENPYQDHDLKANNKKYKAHWLTLKTFPIENIQEKVYRIVAHISDVTQSKAELHSLKETQSKNAGTIRMLVHDLKNPLSNIILLSDLAKKEFEKGASEQGYSFLTLIRQVGQETARLVEGMLVDLELSTSPLQKEKVDLNALIRTSLSQYTGQLEAYQIQMEMQLPDEPTFVLLDEQRFRHVIDNLLNNALKFTPKGGKIKVQVRQNSKRAVLQISDSGIGIPADKQKQIFQEFSKARRRGLHGEKSSGLGLSIVRKIVELHQGGIKVESKEGKGTIFTIELKY